MRSDACLGDNLAPRLEIPIGIWRCSSVIECVLSRSKALGLIPNNKAKQGKAEQSKIKQLRLEAWIPEVSNSLTCVLLFVSHCKKQPHDASLLLTSCPSLPILLTNWTKVPICMLLLVPFPVLTCEAFRSNVITHQQTVHRVPPEICVWCLQQAPVSAFVVRDESLHLVVNLLVSQEHSLYPCYLGKIDMAEKYINLRRNIFTYFKKGTLPTLPRALALGDDRVTAKRGHA